jgi:von willebrand factor type A
MISEISKRTAGFLSEKMIIETEHEEADNDGLLDGEESYDGSIYAKYGIYFDPLNPDTNGNGILGGDEVFGQSKHQEVETHDEAITEVNVDMDTNGNLEKNLTIKSMYNIDAISTNVYAMIGEPFNFTSSTDFESATITFKVDQSKLGDTLFDNLIILWYNEEDQIFEEMPTVSDAVNSTVSTTTTHFSQYMVVDSVKWYANWNNSLNELRKMWIGNTSYQKNLHTILMLDCSSSMASTDYYTHVLKVGYNGVTEENIEHIRNSINSQWDAEHYCVKWCDRFEISENLINSKGNSDVIGIITFADSVQYDSGLSYKPEYLKRILNERINNNGGTAYLNSALAAAQSHIETNTNDIYRIVVITDNNITFDSISSDDFSNNTIFNIINVGSSPIGYGIEEVAKATGGDAYNAVSADELTNESGGIIYTPEQFVGIDSDGDGIPDIVELYGLKFNGEPIATDPNKKDTDGDDLYDNDELGYVNNNLILHIDIDCFADVINAIALKPHSDPTKADSDDDGLSDYIDESPMKAFNHLFELASIDNYSKMMDYIPQSIKDDLDKLDDVYATESSFKSDLAALTVLEADFLAHFLPVGKILDKSGNDMPRAAAFLGHFLVASDNLYEYDASEAIACTFAGRNAFNRTVNDLMDIAEESLKDHASKRFAIKSDRTNFTNDDNTDLMVDFYVKNNPMEFDWCYSIGKGTSSVDATLKRDGDKYTMELTFYIIDLYDWDKNDNGNGIV